jgi:tetratricopeptide (TPR) repeat protein
MIEATYFSSNGPNRDRAKGILAYEEMLRLGDSARAANNLAIRLTTRREFARAESLYRVSARLRPDLQRLSLPNLLVPLVWQQKFAEAESVLAIARPRFPENAAVRRTPVNLLYLKGDLPAYRLAVDSVRTRGDSLDRDWGKRRYTELLLLDGRVKEFTRLWEELASRDLSKARDRLNRAIDIPAFARMDLLDQRQDAVRDLDAAVAAAQAEGTAAGEWPYFAIIDFYSIANEPARARQWLNRYDAEVRDTFLLRLQRPGRLRVEGEVLLTERKFADGIASLRRSEFLPDGPVGSCLVCMPMFLSFAFDKAGMRDSTIFYMERTLAVFDPNKMTDVRDPILIPLFNHRLGELYEAKGDRAKAVEHYRKVIDVWKNADPELQVTVNELKARVRRLTDLEGIPR